MITLVEDNEILYRRVDVKPTENYWQRDPLTGELLVTASAFKDSGKKPSVDRANLCGNNPVHTQNNNSDNGVVSLLTGDVRTRATAITADHPTPKHTVDVLHVPEPGNEAHAQIETDPLLHNDKAFRRFRVSLASLANERGWLIRPFGERD